jgi:hypothetical protein
VNPQDEIASVQASVQESARLAARRRLLRGSLGVPAVLTLSSGSALAASSPIRCFNNAPTNASDSYNTYFEVPQYPLTQSLALLGYVVAANDLLGIAAASGGTIEVPFVADAWIGVDSFEPVTVSTDQTIGEASSVSVALRFTLKPGSLEAHPVFTLSGFIPKGSTGSGSGVGRIITTSCWTSFM